MTKKTKSPARGSGVGSSNFSRINDTSLPAQRQRLLDWLRAKPITTIEARRELNILAPAARIWELRHKYGHNIATNWITDVTPEGHTHRVAKYSLLNGKWRKRHGGGSK